ncbi:hypothetical protein BYT27DRAFT_7225308 [Phlegmacium glaucopus]|nr:hypothetical protein BYT27DRAFT_7225308 [Phlegmacium glaucopus]
MTNPSTTTCWAIASRSLLCPREPSQAYFFAFNQYVRIRFTPRKVDDTTMIGLKPIINEWLSLLRRINAARFNTVDATFPSPHDKSEIYFFSGTKYALIKAIPYTTDDKLINGPKTIAAEWPLLREAGFSTVDAVLPNLNGNGMISGSQYALIKAISHTTDDEPINGPKSAATESSSLCQPGFYW